MIFREIDGAMFTEDDAGYPRKLTDVELIQYAAEIQAYKDAQQAAKSAEYKRAENQMMLCFDALRGDSSHKTMTWAELDAARLQAKQTWPKQAYDDLKENMELLQGQLQRFGGTKYWDTMQWHPETST